MVQKFLILGGICSQPPAYTGGPLALPKIRRPVVLVVKKKTFEWKRRLTVIGCNKYLRFTCLGRCDSGAEITFSYVRRSVRTEILLLFDSAANLCKQ